MGGRGYLVVRAELIAQGATSDDEGPTAMVRQSCLPRRQGKKGFDELKTFLPLRPFRG